MSQFTILLLLFLITVVISPSQAQDLHKIKFRSPQLYPEGLTYDPSSQHFIVASPFNLLPNPTFISVSDDGVTETLTLVSSQLPPKSTILGMSVDHRNHRLFAAVNSPSSPFLASFNLNHSSLDLDFLSPLLPSTGIANDVAFDTFGNTYVTNSDKNFIWKLDENGAVSILSNLSLFRKHPVDESSPYSYCGLNGIAYISTNHYLLVVQSNTGKMFKVDAIDGTATTVKLPEDLTFADGIAVKEDGVVAVVSMKSAWFLKSDDSWAHGEVIDKIALDNEGYPTSVTVGNEGRVYVVYGYVQEVIKGISQEREWFRIEEIKIRSKREKEEEEESMMWPIILIGLGLLYFLFWRLQMRQFVHNIDRKRD